MKVSQKVLQYFGNVRHNLATLDAFAKIIKVMNHTGLRDVKLAQYSRQEQLITRFAFMAWSMHSESTVLG